MLCSTADAGAQVAWESRIRKYSTQTTEYHCNIVHLLEDKLWSGLHVSLTVSFGLSPAWFELSWATLW